MGEMHCTSNWRHTYSQSIITIARSVHQNFTLCKPSILSSLCNRIIFFAWLYVHINFTGPRCICSTPQSNTRRSSSYQCWLLYWSLCTKRDYGPNFRQCGQWRKSKCENSRWLYFEIQIVCSRSLKCFKFVPVNAFFPGLGQLFNSSMVIGQNRFICHDELEWILLKINHIFKKFVSET